MGNSCTHAADAVAHVVTQAEINEAVRSIEEWHKVQASGVKHGVAQNNYGPLLQRVGGPDVVKKVVELFYRKLYGDPRLILFLHDQDVMHLRAKQSAFISWLFGPPNMPYLGRSVRIAHLRIIKQRGFNGDDYDLGMRYFEQAMAELGAPESIMGEVMRRLRPFKDAFFTPSAKDAEEEARWVLEEREKEEETRQHQLQEQQQEAYHERERQLQEQITLAHMAAEAEEEAEEEAGGAREWAADAAVAAAVAAALSGAATSCPTTRPPSRGPQCPFTGGRMSRPISCRPAAASTSGTLTAAAAAAAPPSPPTPAAVATLGLSSPGGESRPASSRPLSRPASCRPLSPLVAAPTVAVSADGGGDGTASAVVRPASQLAARPASSSQQPQLALAGPAAPASVRVPSPPAPTPTAAADRPDSVPRAAQAAGTVAAEFPAAAAAVVPPAAAAAAAAAAEIEAELEAIERAYTPDGRKGAGQEVPLLPRSLEPSSSAGAGRAAAVC